MSFKAGTEENGALVAPGFRAVKHISYRYPLNSAHILPLANKPTNSGP